MAKEIQEQAGTYTTASAVSMYRLVSLDSSGTVAHTGVGASPFGVAVRDAASGDPVGVRFVNAPGTFKLVAAGAITRGAQIFSAAAGKVSATQEGMPRGIALEAAAADGDVIECAMMQRSALMPVINKTADASIVEAESGCVFSNLGASGTITLSLPTGVAAGTHFYFVVSAAQRIQIDPGASDAIYAAGAKQADGKYYWADDEAESILLVANSANDWYALFEKGTWTIEP